jgi:hypothetical protein
VVDEPRFAWQCSFRIPWEAKPRMHALVSIRQYLLFARDQTQVNFEMEEDEETATLLWVGARGPLPTSSINEIVLRIEKDIRTILANVLEHPRPPRSVYDWIRENPYK